MNVVNIETLRFPSGRTVAQLKKDAKRLTAERNISYTEALNFVSADNGGGSQWDKAIDELKKSGGHAHFCSSCGDESNTHYNPLLLVQDSENDEGEYERVHLFCAKNDSRYGFCWCCNVGDTKVHLADDLNDANECPDHAGESVPDYPESDGDSFIENIQNNY
jgi:hypothetical protein